MPIALSPEASKQLAASIKRFAAEHLDEEIGDLKAGLVLDYVLAEIAPSVYNRAIRDSQTYFQEKVIDLDGSCHLPEFGYWKR